jgi:orotidine-5'-phosphate decarboxylase
MSSNWVEKLEKFNQEFLVCVGIDPIHEKIKELNFDSIYEWCKFLIQQTSEKTNVYKLQMAYFEQSGIEGLEDLKKTIEYIKSNFPEKIIIGDGKRSDIGSTANAYAEAMYSYWEFDVVTINPYMGSDSIIPFSEKEGAIVICKTSNPGSNEIQNLIVDDGEEVYKKVLRMVEKNNSKNNLGLVVGATFPGELKEIREKNNQIPILIPGLGFQKGNFKETINSAKGNGINIVNSSRGISFPKENISSSEEYKNFITKSLDKFGSSVSEHV